LSRERAAGIPGLALRERLGGACTGERAVYKKEHR